MPIYEYKCAKCGVVEVMQSIKDAPLKKCPNCKSKVERMISSTSFVLKGSGWYATDYGKKTPAPAAETSDAKNGSNGDAKSSDSSKPAEKSASSSESKPATSTEKAKTSSPAKSD